MKLLLELRDENIGLKPKKLNNLTKRDAARAILLKGKKIALLHVTKQNYHKLPGGGLENKESVKKALFRELLEETGCKAKIISEVGKIIEHRTHLDLIQTSYCYVAQVIEEGIPQFDSGEMTAGYKLRWASIDSAIKILEKEKPENYEGKFIVARDLKFIKATKIQLE